MLKKIPFLHTLAQCFVSVTILGSNCMKRQREPGAEQDLEPLSLLVPWHYFSSHFQGRTELKLFLAVCCAGCRELTGTSPAAAHLALLLGTAHRQLLCASNNILLLLTTDCKARGGPGPTVVLPNCGGFVVVFFLLLRSSSSLGRTSSVPWCSCDPWVPPRLVRSPGQCSAPEPSSWMHWGCSAASLLVFHLTAVLLL